MRKILLLALQLLLITPFVQAQCPTAGFTLPDTACVGDNYQVLNTTTGGVQYYWDFCPGDMNTTPQSTMLTNDPSLDFPQQIRAVTENGNHYLFVANLLGNNLLRFDFGNDIDGVPTKFDYGNIGGLFNQPAGLDIVNDNGVWYALVTNIGLNNVIRVNLGTVISDNLASGIDLGNFGLSIPRGAKIAKDAGNYYAFISSVTGNSLTKIDFGSSLGNTPATFNVLTDPSFDVPWGFEIAFDCTINTWVGFYASNTLSKINVIDFGSTLANPGAVTSSIPCLPSPTGLAMTTDDNKWYILANSFTTSEFQKIQISGSLLSTPSSSQIYTIPQSTSPRNITILRDSSNFKVFIANNQPSSINKLEFSQPCTVSPPFSNDSAYIAPTYGSINYFQEIVLEAYGPNGEISFYADSMYIGEAPKPGFIHTNVCGLQPISFTDTSIVNPALTSTWQWDFGDGSSGSTDQSPVHLYSTTGAFNVTLTVTYLGGCSVSVSDSVYVYDIPTADFTFPNNQCTEVPVLFSDISQAFGGSVINSWLWDFGDGSPVQTDQNPLHPFTVADTYTVSLIVETNNGCSDTISQVFTAIPSPVTDFVISSTCVGETVSFTNTTTMQGGGSLGYDWDFGDSFTSIAINPTHPYAAIPANYIVTLIATATNGCKDTLVQDIRIANKPVPQFTYSPTLVCKFNQVTFTNTSFGVGGDTISNYLWDFGDSGTSTDQNPFHAYSDTGYFNVTLTVVSPTACDSSITQQVYVIPSPTATFTAAGVCLGLTTNFNPFVTTPPGTQVDSIVWDFGDGNTFTGLTSPTHLYSSPGTYGVTMTVYNNLLCTGSYLDSIDVYPIPVANFSTGLACSGSAVSFDGTLSQVTGDTLSTWLWNFDGLGTSTDSITQFTFQNAGTYNVSLLVSTIHGCQNTTTTAVTIIQSPQFDFVFNEPCFGSPSNFTYIPLILPAPSAVLSWDFGDGTISSQLSPVHTYSTIDTFSVSLTVLQNSTGCSTVIYKNLVIKPFADAGFTFNNGCEDLPVQFTDTSTILSGSVTGWNWNFGALGTSTSASPVVTPAIPGTYPVILTVTSDQGCAISVSDSLIVYGNPIAAFIPDPLYGSPPLTVNFINNTTGGVSYNWDFGDGSNGTGFAVNHVYQDTGLYNITLIAESAEGCLNSTSTFISVLIPYLDIAVNKVYVTEDNDLLTISAELLNTGNVPVSNFQIAANIQNGSVINEAWTGVFQPGNVIVYTFNARYDITSKSLPEYYCVKTSAPNDGIDQNPSNDEKCAVLLSVFDVYSVSPNPFNDQFSLNFNLPESGEYEINIFDMTGRVVYESSALYGKKGFNKQVIPTAGFAVGMYAVVVKYRDEVKTLSVLRN